MSETTNSIGDLATDDEFRVRYESDDTTETSMAVVEAVAAATETEPTEMPPLARSVDPDALDTLFASADGPIDLSFRYGGVTVTLECGGVIVVESGPGPV
ncbi:HalOD1 output domain-containing protein [Halosimplex salinum]|uniref:HalOD1 output domain-containing protein n=1 Tax=Halosimplex salinum TaxID=1710538 RepID=UPI000F4AC055|nr:HalOD1 output domain-containing protein [Halosimplex salinum]